MNPDHRLIGKLTYVCREREKKNNKKLTMQKKKKIAGINLGSSQDLTGRCASICGCADMLESMH